MKLLVSIYQDEDGTYIAECPSIPGCVSQGASEAEAESNLADAIRACLAVRAEKGMPLTAVTKEIEVAVSCRRSRCCGRTTWFVPSSVWGGRRNDKKGVTSS